MLEPNEQPQLQAETPDTASYTEDGRNVTAQPEPERAPELHDSHAPAAPAVNPQPMQTHIPNIQPLAQPSYFDGRTIQLIGWRLLGILLSAITLGIAAPWAECMILRWQAKHTVVEGQRLRFDGKGHQLLGRYLLWGLLILVTFGIYTIFLPVRMRKWQVKHLSFATSKEPPKKPVSGGTVALVAVSVAAALLLAALVGVLIARPFAEAGVATLPTTLPNTTAPATQQTTTLPQDTTVPESIWYVNSPTGLYVRDSAEADYETIDHLEYGTQVIVQYWEGKLGFIGYGWCNSDYLTQEKPEQLPQNTDKNHSGTSIVGSWHGFSLSDDGEWLTLHTTWVFMADGTFETSNGESGFTYSEEGGLMFYGTGADWFRGTYELKGNTLELTFLEGIYAGGYPSEEVYPIVKVYDSVSVGSDTLYITGEPLYKGDVEDLAVWLLTR